MEKYFYKVAGGIWTTSIFYHDQSISLVENRPIDNDSFNLIKMMGIDLEKYTFISGGFVCAKIELLELLVNNNFDERLRIGV